MLRNAARKFEWRPADSLNDNGGLPIDEIDESGIRRDIGPLTRQR